MNFALQHETDGSVLLCSDRLRRTNASEVQGGVDRRLSLVLHDDAQCGTLHTFSSETRVFISSSASGLMLGTESSLRNDASDRRYRCVDDDPSIWTIDDCLLEGKRLILIEGVTDEPCRRVIVVNQITPSLINDRLSPT